MPIETIINNEHPFAVQLVTRSLLADEVVAAQKNLYLAPGHDPSTPVLWDTRTVDVKASITDMLKMVDDSTDLWSQMVGGRTAILVGATKDVATARIYQQFASSMPRDLKIFTEYDEAVSWLLEAGQSAESNAS